MSEITEPKKRIRINVARSVKNVFTYECTVEYYDRPVALDSATDALAESDALVAELEQRYPAAEA